MTRRPRTTPQLVGRYAVRAATDDELGDGRGPYVVAELDGRILADLDTFTDAHAEAARLARAGRDPQPPTRRQRVLDLGRSGR